MAAAVSSLQGPGCHPDRARNRGLLASAAESLGQLTGLTGNLLGMSRLQAGTLPLRPQPTDVADTFAHVVASLGPQAAKVPVAIPEGLPRAIADPALLERALISLLSSAIVPEWMAKDKPAGLVGSGVVGQGVVLAGSGLARAFIGARDSRSGSSAATRRLGRGSRDGCRC